MDEGHMYLFEKLQICASGHAKEAGETELDREVFVA